LVAVTRDHLSYVNYFLFEENEENRKNWEEKRFKILKISFFILNGINQLISKVKNTDFYETFINTKRNIFHNYDSFMTHKL